MQAIVIGAGIGGLSTAIALQNIGIKTTVYERAAAPRAAGAGLIVWRNGLAALQQIGAEAVLSVGLEADAAALHRWEGTRLSDMGTPQLLQQFERPLSLALHRVDLMHALLDLAGPMVRYGAAFSGYEQTADAVTAHFSDGSRARADLLIGADGIHSQVRQQMHPTTVPIYRGYAAWRAVVAFDHAQVGDYWGETWGRGARFGIVPLTEGRVYWFASANRPANSVPDHHPALLQQLYGDWHQPIPALLNATPNEALLYNDIADFDPPPTWVEGRVVLLGDAAHAMTPNMGQGACQALLDAAALQTALRPNQLLATALAAYQAERREAVTRIVTTSRQIGRIGQLNGALLTSLRDGAVRLLPSTLMARQLAPVLAH